MANIAKECKSSSSTYLGEFHRLVGKTDDQDDEVLSMYKTFADQYDQEVDDSLMSAEITARYFNKHAERFGIGKDCEIIDIAAGTGNAGERLRARGYSQIDAIEPCEEMLNKAKDKHIYRKTFIGKVGGGSTLPMADDTYDAATVSAAVVPGHMPYDAFLEILRVIKPGGIVVNVMREEFTWQYPQCNVRVPFGRWEAEGRWNIVEWAIPEQKYYDDKDGLVHVYRKPTVTN